MIKKSFLQILVVLFVTMFFGNVFANAILKKDNDNLLENEKFLVFDVHTVTPFPKKFRVIPNLNISGSAQFLPFHIKKITNEINNKNINIVDLRQESHGFINEMAVSFYSTEKALNNGLGVKEVIKQEDSDLKEIKLNSEVNIHNIHGKIIKTLISQNVINEFNVAKNNGLNYIRLPVRDGHIPSPSIVDEFVKIVKSKSKKDHFHFHCKHGDGRTTTFMSMYEMMINEEGKITVKKSL